MYLLVMLIMLVVLRSFKAIIDGDADEYPENAFFNVGTIDDVIAKAEVLVKEEKEK